MAQLQNLVEVSFYSGLGVYGLAYETLLGFQGPIGSVSASETVIPNTSGGNSVDRHQFLVDP